MSLAKPVRCSLPGTHTTRSGTPSTSTGSVASRGPTMKATMYVDIGMVSSKSTRTLPPPTGDVAATGEFDTAVWPSATTRLTRNTALRSGSSQHGKARRASVASNCVVAIVRVAPASSVNVER